MIELVYLNPNISREDADKLVKTANDRREQLINKAFSNLDEIKDPKAKSDYLSGIATAFLMF